MRVLASLFVNSEDDDLSSIEDLPIQLAFFMRSTFRDFDHEKFLPRLEAHNIKVESVHAPAADVFHSHGDEFIQTLAKIKDVYKVNIITVHPQRGTKQHAKSHFRKIEQKIKDLGVIIAYETFEQLYEDRKWITQVAEMHKYFDALKFDFLGVTYDFTHSESGKNLSEIRKYNLRIHAIHFSDARSNMPLDPNEKHQHLPLGYGDYPVLEFMNELENINYSGFIILEYLPQHQHLIKKDTLLLSEYFKNNKKPFLDEFNFRRQI